MYCPVSYKELSYFTNGLLSVPGDCFGLFNAFEVDTHNFKYDEEKMKCEVEEYGLFGSDELKEYVTEDIFEAINAKYWKIEYFQCMEMILDSGVIKNENIFT